MFNVQCPMFNVQTRLSSWGWFAKTPCKKNSLAARLRALRSKAEGNKYQSKKKFLFHIGMRNKLLIIRSLIQFSFQFNRNGSKCFAHRAASFRSIGQFLKFFRADVWHFGFKLEGDLLKTPTAVSFFQVNCGRASEFRGWKSCARKLKTKGHDITPGMRCGDEFFWIGTCLAVLVVETFGGRIRGVIEDTRWAAERA